MRFPKLFGYIFLMVGFFAVSVRPYPPGGAIKAICLKQLEKMPQQEAINRDEVLAAMGKAASSAYHIGASPPIGGGLIMFVGGILIDIGSRQKKNAFW